jgi:hypothetical protein
MNPSDVTLIGAELCQCRDSCKGIKRDQVSGDFPRGLNFEPGEIGSNVGTVVCGLNPGAASQREKDFILNGGGTYSALAAFWSSIQNIPYFDRPRRLIRGLGRMGPILWTDLVKCENESSEVELSFRHHSFTFRHCTSKFLSREIALIPPDWLIVCVGWEAYRGITYMFPERPTLGVPHPSGSYGHFTPFFEENRVLKELFRKNIESYFSAHPKGTLWVDPKKNLQAINSSN